MATKKGTRKRRVKKNIETGVAHIHSTFNNTLIMITVVNLPSGHFKQLVLKLLPFGT